MFTDVEGDLRIFLFTDSMQSWEGMLSEQRVIKYWEGTCLLLMTNTTRRCQFSFVDNSAPF